MSQEDYTGAGNNMHVTIPSFRVPTASGTLSGWGAGLTLAGARRSEGLNT